MVRVRVTDDYEVCCEVEVIEDPDWDYARNKQVLIRKGVIEYSTSSFNAPISTSLGVMYGGNRDFTWQGLLIGPINNVLYKALDAIYYCALDAEHLKPILVVSKRTSADYIYIDEDGEKYVVTISINVKDREAFLSAYAERPTVFLPLLDIRKAESSIQPIYTFYEKNGSLIVESSAAPITLEIRGFEEIRKMDLALEWVYKLDEGWRRIEDGKVLFIKHVRKIYAPFALISRSGTLEIRIPLPFRFKSDDIEHKAKSGLRKLHYILKSVSPDLPPQIIDVILLRVNRLVSFGVPLGPTLAPEAGSMWFRRIWARDLLEGLRWNMITYLEIFGFSEWLINLVRYLILIAHRNNGLRVFIEHGDYVSDAFPQLINVAVMLYERTREYILLREATKIVLEAYGRLKSSKGFSDCRLYEGLIVCRANSSWLDVLYPINGVMWPTRLPIEWMGKVSPEEDFALLEVNSLFIQGLTRLIRLLELTGEKPPEELNEFRSELLQGYKKWFLRDDYLPPITVDPVDSIKDYTASSLCLIALTSLKEILYNRERLRELWSNVERLLVKRKMIELGSGYEIFGALLRDSERKPYLGDLEYHGAVIWPRDTPYLIDLMLELGMKKEVYGILINNLDHMISEGAIGYANELFSLPLGQNPFPAKEYSSNPIPVKNYAQYWSHWCDPYIKYFAKIR
ncbi:MAG: hypothetical protein QW424_06500 [Candidatus Bathyarchaeia archaeon]